MKEYGTRITKKVINNFWKKVLITPFVECWLWTGYSDRYGIINPGNKINLKTHRFSWMLHFGEIPKGLYVCHKCDVPLCVNPSHLFLGTQKDNMNDCLKKGRRIYQKGLKTHCPKGHKYVAENLIKSRLPEKICKICHGYRNKK